MRAEFDCKSDIEFNPFLDLVASSFFFPSFLLTLDFYDSVYKCSPTVKFSVAEVPPSFAHGSRRQVILSVTQLQCPGVGSGTGDLGFLVVKRSFVNGRLSFRCLQRKAKH